MRLEIFAALVLWASAAGSAQASIIEETIKVPVRIVNGRGATIEREIYVSLFYESSAPKPYPVAVLNHGRSGDAVERNSLRTGPYAPAARWFAGFGFMVAVPIRIGYGMTSGEDVEDSGACDSKDYPPGFHAAALQTLAVVNELRKRPDIAKDRGVILGQSFGGTTAMAVAAINPPGIQGAINFAGGGGGGPKSHPQRPCGEPKLHRLFAGYGETSRMPTLWLYSENDQYFGPQFPPNGSKPSMHPEDVVSSSCFRPWGPTDTCCSRAALTCGNLVCRSFWDRWASHRWLASVGMSNERVVE